MSAPAPRPAPTPADWARLYDALLALAVGEAQYAAAAHSKAAHGGVNPVSGGKDR